MSILYIPKSWSDHEWLHFDVVSMLCLHMNRAATFLQPLQCNYSPAARFLQPIRCCQLSYDVKRSRGVCIATYRIYLSTGAVIAIRVRANMCTAIHNKLHMYVYTARFT